LFNLLEKNVQYAPHQDGDPELQEHSRMDDDNILKSLVELATRLGMEIRYEPLKIEGSLYMGGLCRVKGKDFIIVHKKATTQERIRILSDALKRRPLGDIRAGLAKLDRCISG
jgi:hypothetical protein